MKAKAFAPATVANVAVGFDILGFALKNLGETATVELVPSSREVCIEPIEGYTTLSLDPRKNTATAGLLQLIKDKKLDHGFRVSLKKSIPVGSGLGGSSTSAVATIVAANALLKKSLTPEELLHYALIGEEVASGARHGDNIAPCLLGGLVFVRGRGDGQEQGQRLGNDRGANAKSRASKNRVSSDWITVQIKTPPKLHCVVLLPDIRINTKEARSILKPNVSLKTMVEQTANLTGVILGCVQNDFGLIRSSMQDAVIEAQRASHIPGFYDFQKIARRQNAVGCSISGSGSAIFAWTESLAQAERLRLAWLRAARKMQTPIVGAWTSPIHRRGAHVVGVQK